MHDMRWPGSLLLAVVLLGAPIAHAAPSNDEMAVGMFIQMLRHRIKPRSESKITDSPEDIKGGIIAGAVEKTLGTGPFEDGVSLGYLLSDKSQPSFLHDNPWVQITKDGTEKSYEARLYRQIVDSAKPLGPADVFGLSLDVCDGDYPLAMLTCHNMLKEVAYSKRHMGMEATFGWDTIDRRDEQEIVAHDKSHIGEVIGKLVNVRPSGDRFEFDKMGPWYHMFGLFFLSSVTSSDYGGALGWVENKSRWADWAISHASSLWHRWRLSDYEDDTFELEANIWAGNVTSVLNLLAADGKKVVVPENMATLTVEERLALGRALDSKYAELQVQVQSLLDFLEDPDPRSTWAGTSGAELAMARRDSLRQLELLRALQVAIYQEKRRVEGSGAKRYSPPEILRMAAEKIGWKQPLHMQNHPGCEQYMTRARDIREGFLVIEEYADAEAAERAWKRFGGVDLRGMKFPTIAKEFHTFQARLLDGTRMVESRNGTKRQWGFVQFEWIAGRRIVSIRSKRGARTEVTTDTRRRADIIYDLALEGFLFDSESSAPSGRAAQLGADPILVENGTLFGFGRSGQLGKGGKLTAGEAFETREAGAVLETPNGSRIALLPGAGGRLSQAPGTKHETLEIHHGTVWCMSPAGKRTPSALVSPAGAVWSSGGTYRAKVSDGLASLEVTDGVAHIKPAITAGVETLVVKKGQRARSGEAGWSVEAIPPAELAAIEVELATLTGSGKTAKAPVAHPEAPKPPATMEARKGPMPGWSDDGSGNWAATKHGYLFRGKRADILCHAHFGQPMQDCVIEIDVRKLAGDSKESKWGYGLYLRSDGFGRTYYECIIQSGGQFQIGKAVGGRFVKLKPFSRSAALVTGHRKWNTLKVALIGSTLSFYANGTLLASVEDGTLEKGKVGLFAVDAKNSVQPDVVEFRNIRVTKLR